MPIGFFKKLRGDESDGVLAASDQHESQRKGLSTAKPFSWEYSSSADSMTGKVSYHAVTVSTNQFELGFPYEGLQSAYLEVRTHASHGKSVILRIERGQFVNEGDGYYLLAKFGNAKPVTLRASEPADLDTTLLFIHGYSSFVGKLRGCKTLSIEANLYQEGVRMFEFDVDGFDQKYNMKK